MSDVEMMCARNWEQRRHAEEYEAAGTWDWEDAEYEDVAQETPEQKAYKKSIRRRRTARAARDAGRVALGMSTVSALVGLELLSPLFLLIAVIFYAVRFELDPESEGIWLKIKK